MRTACFLTALPLALAVVVAPKAQQANVAPPAAVSTTPTSFGPAAKNQSRQILTGRNQSASVNFTGNSNAEEEEEEERAELAALRAKLSKVGGALSQAFVNEGTLSKTKVAAAVRMFIKELGRTLNETATMRNTTKAVRRLRESVQVVHALSRELTMQQVELMRKGEEEEQNLLLGVLMTRQHEPMNKQFEVLRNPEFEHLPVAVVLLKANDTSVPLFQQVAAYLDRKAPRNATAKDAPANATNGAPNNRSLRGAKDGRPAKPDVGPVVQALERQLTHLEDNAKLQAKRQAEEMKALEAAAQKKENSNNTKAAHRIRRLAKEETRKHAKLEALHRHDIETLKAAVVAIKQGDMAALLRAKNALQESLRAVQAQSGGFLYLIQTLHRTEGRDCPYCVAQCIDKCHTTGTSYAACLTDCADAGK